MQSKTKTIAQCLLKHSKSEAKISECLLNKKYQNQLFFWKCKMLNKKKIPTKVPKEEWETSNNKTLLIEGTDLEKTMHLEDQKVLDQQMEK